jgi:outer membrane lipase/esterase
VRVSRTLVVGILATDIQQHADFDSSQSIVSGNVKGSGGGATVYLDQDIGDAYLNFSLGVQRISLDTTRVVTYGSNNPQVGYVNTTLTSSTNATSLMVTGGGGYTFYLRRFSAQPYLNWQYLRTHIAGFQESATSTSTDPEFAATVAAQTVTSLISIAGVKLQYAWSLPFGVLLPYAYGEYRHEFANRSINVDSNYTTESTAATGFQLPTDSIDPNYYEVGAGLMGVLAGRTQIYVQYMRLLSLQYYSDYGISGGIRFQF